MKINYKKLFLILFIFILSFKSLNKIYPTEIGISPFKMNFNLKGTNYSCNNISVYSDKDIVLYKLFYSKMDSKNFLDYNLSDKDLRISENITNYYDKNNPKKRIFEICLKENDFNSKDIEMSKYYGIFLINVDNLNLASLLYIRKDNNSILENDTDLMSGRFIQDNFFIKNKNSENLVLFLLVTQFLLETSFLSLILKYFKFFRNRNLNF
jgi:hypothetical protein